MGVTATDLAHIPMSPELGSALARGADFAGSAGAEEMALEHLLVALCDDHDAIAVLRASGIDNEQLRADVVSRAVPGGLSSQTALPEDIGVSYDVRRILEAAAAAAKGSRRREINGAIVLAAIVGDGRSLASDTLQAHGLTFDGAIRALQAALAPSSDVRPPAPAADDVLARARERVQSRSTPSLREIMGDMRRPVSPQLAAASEPADEGPALHEPEAQAPAMPSFTLPQADEANADRAKEEPPQDLHAVEPHLAMHPQTTPGEAVAPGPAVPSGLHANVDQQRPPAWPSLTEQPGTPAPRAVPGQPAAGAHPVSEPALDQTSTLFAGRGGDIPDFIRQRKSTVVPPPIPPAPQMPGRGPAAVAAIPAPSVVPPRRPAVQPSLRADQRPQPAQLQQKGPAKRGKRGAAGKVEAGKLAENIPRAMRAGKTARVEVRIAKTSVQGLADGLAGPSAARAPTGTSPKAMSVRIRAPDGGFYIETASPETQWIESSSGFADDDIASWRFLITPQECGWLRLQIIASARTVGADGVAAEAALPDQTVDVKVRRNVKRTLAKIAGWTVAAMIGGLLATFGQPAAELIGLVMTKLGQ